MCAKYLIEITDFTSGKGKQKGEEEHREKQIKAS
jgi:hypothetical protein